MIKFIVLAVACLLIEEDDFKDWEREQREREAERANGQRPMSAGETSFLSAIFVALVLGLIVGIAALFNTYVR